MANLNGTLALKNKKYIPSGKRLQKAIEHGHRNSGFTQLYSMVDLSIFFVNVYQRVNKKTHGVKRLNSQKKTKTHVFFCGKQ